ncbi:RagB/SusD family nutrient uptake outer membrane protein [Sphingobacterium sp. SRCM116780]|uniref:RagB/SusD family nutrient uptake outer membrane protein n=1 Tax=Sphingobacterium sp. SRCM116780 TaxID=2907623 RepID=UPI001F228952|nr:RagB/SusD family nutrient uptake outer membrane protein [Sphingobacterium sp. SRCM116780]UIR56034.1 RagB/SusD family nutrient uptake outer membrane protein [Sphingobacterium sp. SRCM116780]
MKRIYKNSFFRFLGIALLVSSCSLNRDPLDGYSDESQGITETGSQIVFKNKSEVDNFLTGIYQQMRDRQEHWHLDLLLIGDSHADNSYAGTTGAEVLPFENNSIEGSNSVVDRDWGRYLEDIARANRLIINVDSVADKSVSDADIKLYKAQGKIFRALAMFDMVRIFGSIPVITTAAGDITAENVEEVYPQYFPKQATEEEAYKQIEKDLLDALADAPNNNVANKTLFTKSVARAMLAKVYAEKPIRDYNKVIQYADALAADGFDLNTNYADLYALNAANTDLAQRNTKESILEAQFMPGSGNWATWMFGRDLSNYDNNFTWAKWVTPSRDLIQTYTNEGDQIRMDQSIVYYTTTWSNYYPANHYPFMFKLRSGMSSIIKLRYADILLLKAEALIQQGSNLSAAADIIDKIRTRVNLPKLNVAIRGNKDALFEAYLKERRLELAFEGQRWFDLVRLDKVESVMNAVYAKDSGRKTQVYPFNQYSYRLPVPQAKIDQNPNLVQNPGY